MMHKVITSAGQVFNFSMPSLNAILGLAIVAYIVHRLLCCAARYTVAERAGMGAIASGMVMATPALWLTGTPFDGWSFNVARVGVFIYIVSGGMRRDRHERKNVEMREHARLWLARRDDKR